jgi:hypothetical protein
MQMTAEGEANTSVLSPQNAVQAHDDVNNADSFWAPKEQWDTRYG